MAQARTQPITVLVADDEKNIRKTLRHCLESLDCKVQEAAGQDELERALAHAPLDLVLLDLRFGSKSGLELLPRVLERQPETAVVMITAYGTIDTAVQAMQAGAVDFLSKPFSPAQIERLVVRVAER